MAAHLSAARLSINDTDYKMSEETTVKHLTRSRQRTNEVLSNLCISKHESIDKKQKQVDPTKHNIRIVENNLTELETMQFILSMIIDEEQLSKRNEPTIQQWNRIR